INGNKSFRSKPAKHILKENLKGQIWLMFIPSVRMYFLRFRGAGELTMNGQILREDKVYPFSKGSSVKGNKIAPVYYWDVTMQFLREDFTASRVVYEVRDLEYRFRSNEIGIHKMSFVEESGRMVGIMGASGAGKSTLLSVLNGTNPPYEGEVLINGLSIHGNKDRIKGLIGYVSQDDLLIEELTVFENLYFNAKLCFDNLSDEETVAKVDAVLKNLGLYEIRNMKVGTPLNKKISGGQRKRLNISLELIREPAIMFLDEPTSGLSSRDSENILDLLQELARKGKLLFIVIHQPSSEIFKMFDKLIILDTGGYLIYNGNPVESIEYFKRKIEQANYSESECYACGNVNPEQIFNIVETRVFTESGQPTETRRLSPEDWNKLYKGEINKEELEPETTMPSINFQTPNKFRQLLVFIKRDVLSKISDRQYLLITMLEAPVLAFFLAFLIRYFDESASEPRYSLFNNSNLPVYIFMSVIVAIFMGLTVSAEEIFKDRKILRREAFLNLSWNSYLLSKVFVQFGISAIQALTFVIVGNAITGIREMMFHYWLVLFTCWAGANVLGLVISDSFKAVVTIYILIPFLVIPQIILSGVLVKFEKLNPNISSPVEIPFYGEMITSRWGYEALAVKQFINNRYEQKFYRYDKAKSEANFRRSYWYNEVKERLDLVRSDLEKNKRGEQFEANLALVRHEITREMKRVPQIEFTGAGNLTPESINISTADAALVWLDRIRKYYNEYYDLANRRKDAIVNTLQSDSNSTFALLQSRYYNKALEEFVTYKNENRKVIVFRGEVVQKADPIFLDTEYPFIKAHFYAPRKQVFGRSTDTYLVNVIVLWMMTILLYLILYHRLLRKALESGERFMGRKKKQGD
ncbi:MAG: ATP-binding cassette domain-containing protein, partial [Bacteroidales bacterium]|nr:ATP-binding cassette domain-containing protein [Bacteroidales bacterium]